MPPTSQTHAAYRLASLGFDMLIALLVFGGIGYLLDRWLATRWIVIAGLLLGLIVGMYRFIKDATAASKSAAAVYRAEHSLDGAGTPPTGLPAKRH